MAETLEQIVKRKQEANMSAIEVHRWLKENNMGIPWIIVRRIYMKVRRDKNV